MFATGIYPTGDLKLDTYIQNLFISMIEIEVLEYLHNDWDEKDSPEEFLEDIFPRAFIHRNPKKAVEIIYDLDDIARSNIVRNNLPPLHIYAMYNIICNYEELKDDLGKNEYDLKVETYIRKTYSKKNADWFCSLFDAPSENFVENYDDEYIWLDLWQHKFLGYLDYEKTIPLLTPEAEEMLQLMPNDIQKQWELLKKTTERASFVINNEYDFFISHATEDKQAIAEPLALELRKRGAKVWLDKFEMTIGNSLRNSIDYGIAHSKYGIIILSKNYMRKFWTEKEMNAFYSKISLDNTQQRVLLPIWHNVTKEEVANYSPMLADLLALNTEDYTISALADQLVNAKKVPIQ